MLSPFQHIAYKKASAIIDDYIGHNCYKFDGCHYIAHGVGQNFFSCEAVLIAHWDPDGKIDPYVQYMARHFCKMGKKVVLCSSCDVSGASEEWKCFDAVVCRTCPGCDFVSWKAGLEAFPSLYGASELTLCTDSVFAPVGSYEPVYDAMNAVDCDCWGMTLSRQPVPHVQSAHIVLRKKALRHDAFKHFINSIAPDNEKNATTEHALSFALWLEMHGLRIGCYRPFASHGNPMEYWQKVLKFGIPLINRDLFSAGGSMTPLPAWQKMTDKYGYPHALILNYFFRIGIDISPALCVGRRSRQWPPSVFPQQKDIVLPAGIYTENRLKVAAVLHCFYPDVLKEKLLSHISYLPESTHLYISTDTKEKASAIKIMTAHLPLAKIEIRVMPNKGWDIAPFLAGFRDVLQQYDLICKIHAKSSPHMESHLVDEWHDLLFGSLLGSEEHLIKIIALFNRDSRLGLLAPPSLPFNRMDSSSNAKMFYDVARRLNIVIGKTEAIDFAMGSMFWARSDALMPLLNLNLTFDDFECTDANYRDGSLAHALERCFILSCCKSGHEWGRVPPAPYSRLSRPAPLSATSLKLF